MYIFVPHFIIIMIITVYRFDFLFVSTTLVTIKPCRVNEYSTYIHVQHFVNDSNENETPWYHNDLDKFVIYFILSSILHELVN